MTSAVKVDGERLYKKAHRGEVVETPVKEVEIEAIDVLDFDEAAQTMRCRIACSKGTYVRQLAIDIGEAVGAGAHLEQLSRTRRRRPAPRRGADAGRVRGGRRGARGRRRAHPRPRPAGRGACSSCPASSSRRRRSTAVRNGARLPGGPQEPVRLTFRGELIAIYGPAEEGNALKLLVKL